MCIEFKQLGKTVAALAKCNGRGYYASGKTRGEVIEKLIKSVAEDRVK